MICAAPSCGNGCASGGFCEACEADEIEHLRAEVARLTAERDALVAAQPDYAVRVVLLTRAVREYLASRDGYVESMRGGSEDDPRIMSDLMERDEAALRALVAPRRGAS